MNEPSGLKYVQGVFGHGKCKKHKIRSLGGQKKPWHINAINWLINKPTGLTFVIGGIWM